MTVEKLGDTYTQRGNVTGRGRQRLAEMHLQAKEHRDCQQSTRSWGEAWSRFSRTASEGTNPAYTSISDLQPLELSDNGLLLFKLPQLWYTVTEALGNKYLYLMSNCIIKQGNSQETDCN